MKPKKSAHFPLGYLKDVKEMSSNKKFHKQKSRPIWLSGKNERKNLEEISWKSYILAENDQK